MKIENNIANNCKKRRFKFIIIYKKIVENYMKILQKYEKVVKINENKIKNQY